MESNIEGAEFIMAKKGKKKEEGVVEVVFETEGEKVSTVKRPKKVAAQGKKHRTGARHRPRTNELLQLLDDEKEEEIEFEE